MDQNREDIELFREIAEIIPEAIIVTDREASVVFSNRAACKMVGREPDRQSECSLHDFLWGDSLNSRLNIALYENSLTGQPQSISVKKEDGAELFVKMRTAQWGSFYLLTLQDITREVVLLRSTDLQRREKQAKNTLLERCNSKLVEKQRTLEELLDNLPEALLSVSEAFVIEAQNQAAAKFKPKGLARKCHEYLGYNEPCPGCPARDGFALLEDVKKIHTINDRYITESISASHFGTGGMLLFRDTTRQIKLIEQIRYQQQALTEKNNILKLLSDFTNFVQKENKIKAVVDCFWKSFLPLLQDAAALLLINDIRPGNLWLADGQGVTDEDLMKVSRAYLSRDMQSLYQEALAEDFLPWPTTSQILLYRKDRTLAGLLLLQGAFTSPEAKEIIDLFSEPLGTYIDNRLLTRKLEEKANTDPLTGLYNRGYLEQAILEETEKRHKLNLEFSVVVADVNQLKKANDHYGHEAGDRLILKVSQLLRQASREIDIVARTGGDEFVILLPDTTEKNALHFTERLGREVFGDCCIKVGEHETFPVSVSLGAAGSDLQPPEELTKAADRAMYEAKEDFYRDKERYR
ncbi:MAG: GGDEF domain-containing protein [Deltaproteobacteria bacterium]|nr:GGDEF domain-containing protein [Deltaproteobacteria bacterium]